MIKKLAHRFFAWYCRRELYETISGDLEELYQRRKSLRTPGYASRRLAWDVLLLMRPGIVRPFGIVDLNHVFDMFRNYLTIGLRNLRKHPVNTLIHVLGLALGLAAFLLLHHYTRFEKSYDLFHQEPHQLYRLTTDDVKEGRIQVRDAMSFAPSGRALQEDIPEVVGSTTTYKTWRMVFRKGSEPVEENDVIAVDSNFLHLFNYPVLQGNVDDMLTKPHSIVLTEDQAAKYFGTDDPMGKTVHVLGSFDRPFEVTGVIGNVPPNTHYTFNTLVSLSSFSQQIENDAWDGFNYYTYLKLRPDADLAKVRAMLPALSKKYLGDETRLQFNLQPVPEIHLHSDFTYEPEIHGSVTAVRFLGIISVLILIIAWFNYINLSTARAIERAREVGLRKVIGAQRKQLVIQFLTEALMINLMGALCALLLAQLCLPYFHGLVGKPVISSVLGNHAFMRDLGIFFLAGTLLTGLYPALVLSSFKPISVLRGSFGRSRQGTLLRKALVTLQFTASLILISGTIIIYQQIRHMTAADLGIHTAQVIGFDNADLPQMSSDERRSTYYAFAD
ncbi:MAG: ABC transporter permease, partial [Saprospiraceae bacterium]|nr:ABC transporter permease [Saprospiraceae bacterium]